MKTFYRKSINLCFYIFLIGCFCILNTTCGLDQYYVLEGPLYTSNRPEASNEDYPNKYFEFYTNETTGNNSDYLKSSSEFKFLGTDIYYKIYNNSSTLNSDINSLDALINSSNSASSASRMIESYSYKQLQVEGRSQSPLIEATGTNKKIKIRLTDYFTDFPSEFSVDDSKIGRPLRNDGIGNYTFNFGRNLTDERNSKLPLENDADVKYSSSFTTPDIWYVNLYAVALGRDSTYITYYSNILHLGTVQINAASENN